MRSFGRVIIAALLVFILANSAMAGVYNNSGTSAEDSICFVGVNISADGRRALSVTAASDSLYVLVFYPGGTLAFRDSCLMNDAKITIAAFEDQAAVSGFSYKNSVAAVDGAGINGTYKVIWSIRDVDSANTTFGISEAQVFSTGADVSYSQALTDANSLTFTVANEVNANMRYYEGADGVDAEIQSEVEDGINAATDINTIIAEVTNLDGGTLPWNATTMDSVLQALDYTNNTHEVVRQVASTVATVTTVTNSVGTEIAASEVNADVWTELFASTGGDSILNALDYTNNPKHVYRRLDIDSALIPAIKAKTDQLSFGTLGVNANMEDWGDFGATIVTGAGNYPSVESNTIANGALNSLTFANNAIGSAALSGTAAKEMADSVWKAGIKGTQTGDAESTFADAFVNTGGQAYAIVDFDTSGGTLSDAQVDDLTVNIKADDTVTVVNNVLNVNSADTLERVNSTDAGDTLRAHAPHGNNFASTAASGLDSNAVMRAVKRSWGASTADAGLHDSLTVAQRDVTTASGGSCGSGSQTVTLCVQDTSGTDEFIAQAHVSIYTDAARTSLYADPFTQTGGCQTVNLDASTPYYYSITRAGFTFDTNNFTTGAGGTWGDTLFGYNVVIGSPSLPNLCRLNGNVYDSYGNALQNAIVKVCPDQAGAAKAGNVLVVPRCKQDPTDAAGAFTIDVIISDSLVYQGSGNTTYLYNITVSVEDQNQPGAWNEYIVKERVTIPDSTTYRVDLYLQ